MIVSGELEQTFEGLGRDGESAANILREGDDIGKRMEVVGEEGISMRDMVVYLKVELYDFSYLQQNAFDKEDAYCPLIDRFLYLSLINRSLKPILTLNRMMRQDFFFELQNEMKNMNFMPFNSDRLLADYEHIEEKIEMRQEENRRYDEKLYDRIVDMRGNLITVIAKGVSLGELARIHKAGWQDDLCFRVAYRRRGGHSAVF